MAGMTGRKLGMLSLRLDAAYCVLLGASLAIAAPYLDSQLPLPAEVIVAIGVAIVLWAGAVVWMAARLPLRIALRIVMVANIGAAGAIAASSALAAGVFVLLVILAVAADVGVFAGSQAIALRRLRTASPV